MIIIGIDPGANGGIATGDYTAFKMDIASLQEILTEADRPHVFLEKAQAMPKQGVVSMFTYGKHCGHLEGLISAFTSNIHLVPPRAWQKVMHEGIDPELGPKERSLLAAMKLFPSLDFLASKRCRKPHDGIIDALLIREYGKRTLAGIQNTHPRKPRQLR